MQQQRLSPAIQRLLRRRTMRIRLLCLAASTSAVLALTPADSYTFTISTGSTSTNPEPPLPSAAPHRYASPDHPPTRHRVDQHHRSRPGYAFTGVVPLGPTRFVYDNRLHRPHVTHVDALGDLLTLTSPIGTSPAHVWRSITQSSSPRLRSQRPVDITHSPSTASSSPDTQRSARAILLAALGTGILA
jgi:hypothetical protein